MLSFICSLTLLATVTAQIYGPPPPPDSQPPAMQSTSAPASAPAPVASMAGQHVVQVAANNAFIFSPNTITANAGDTVVFMFPSGPAIHAVTQSSFDAPCSLLNEGATDGSLGFDSGFMASGQFSITIMDATTPIWFHCKQGGPPSHCGSGMVGAVNPPTTGNNTFQAFQQAAVALGSAFPADTGVGQSSLPTATSGSNAGGNAPSSSGAPVPSSVPAPSNTVPLPSAPSAGNGSPTPAQMPSGGIQNAIHRGLALIVLAYSILSVHL